MIDITRQLSHSLSIGRSIDGLIRPFWAILAKINTTIFFSQSIPIPPHGLNLLLAQCHFSPSPLCRADQFTSPSALSRPSRWLIWSFLRQVATTLTDPMPLSTLCQFSGLTTRRKALSATGVEAPTSVDEIRQQRSNRLDDSQQHFLPEPTRHANTCGQSVKSGNLTDFVRVAGRVFKCRTSLRKAAI